MGQPASCRPALFLLAVIPSCTSYLKRLWLNFLWEVSLLLLSFLHQDMWHINSLYLLPAGRKTYFCAYFIFRFLNKNQPQNDTRCVICYEVAESTVFTHLATSVCCLCKLHMWGNSLQITLTTAHKQTCLSFSTTVYIISAALQTNQNRVTPAQSTMHSV